jgi:HSP20 family molecular chaperone IbpA
VPASKPKPRASKSAAPHLVTSEDVQGRVQDTVAALALRAYEIFEQRGRQSGRDLEDWLRAETELLHPARIEIAATAQGLKLRAEAAGFRASDLYVCVEPRRVTIAGERARSATRAAGTTIYAERRSERILRLVDLPLTVDPARATAALRAGICELTLPRAAPAA